MSIARTFLLAPAAVVLLAQDTTRLAGPTSGFVFDGPSHALRVVVGVPGAAYLGAAAMENLDNGSVSPDGKLAVAIQGEAASMLRLADGQATALGAACADARLTWSADSSAVAIACANGVQLFRTASGERSRLAELAGATSIAVDASGSVVYAATAAGIFRLDADSARLLAQLDAAGLALSGGTLYAADRAGKQIVAIDHLSGSASLRRVTGAEDPAAVGVSADGSRLFVAEGESKSVDVFSIVTAERIARLEVDFAPSRVEALGASGLFLLNSRQNATDAVQVLDARQLAVFFIPAENLGSVANLED